MKTEITLKRKIDIRPTLEGVVIKKITEDCNNITIKMTFDAEFIDFIDLKDLSYEIKTIRARGECIVTIDKDDFIKNGHLATEKNFLYRNLYEELPLEYMSMIFESLTCFTYEFI